MFDSIHHLAIIVSDYAKSKHFYTEVLRLKIIREVFRVKRNSYKLDLMLDENFFLEIFWFENSPPRVSYPEACGLRHLAFKVIDINQVIQYLAKHGIGCETIRIDEFTNAKFTFFSDPDGLPLEIYQEI